MEVVEHNPCDSAFEAEVEAEAVEAVEAEVEAEVEAAEEPAPKRARVLTPKDIYVDCVVHSSQSEGA